MMPLYNPGVSTDPGKLNFQPNANVGVPANAINGGFNMNRPFLGGFNPDLAGLALGSGSNFAPPERMFNQGLQGQNIQSTPTMRQFSGFGGGYMNPYMGGFGGMSPYGGGYNPYGFGMSPYGGGFNFLGGGFGSPFSGGFGSPYGGFGGFGNPYGGFGGFNQGMMF